MTDKVTSLCYVSKRDDRSTQICRIADYTDGTLHPYIFTPGSEFTGTNRDILYFVSRTDPVSVGEIAMYEWYVDTVNDKDWTYVSRSTTGWTEVVETSMESPEEIVQAFSHGWSVSSAFTGQHDVIVCCVPQSEKVLCVYVHREDMQKGKNGITLNPGVEALETGMLNLENDTNYCTCRYSPRDTRRYLISRDYFEVLGKVSARSDLDIVSSLIQSEIRTLAQGMLSRREKQLVSSALEKLDTASLKEAVMNRIGCREERAEALIRSCVKHIEGRIDDKDVLAVFDALVENDTPLVERLKSQVAVIFERENEKLRQEAQARLAEIQESIRAAENSLNNVREREKEARRSIERAKQAVAEKQQFAEQVDAEILKRVQAFRENPAAGLLDFAFTSPSSSAAQMAAAKTYSIRRPSAMDEPVKIQDSFDHISSVWNEIVGYYLAPDFTLLSMAAYICRQELLLCGSRADVFADAVARTITGRDAVHVNLSAPIPDLEAFLKELKSVSCPVVCFDDALGSGYDSARSAAAQLKDSLVLYTVRHPESLVMEPASLYISLFPIQTDPLLFSDRLEEEGANCTDQLDDLSAQLSGNARYVASERWFDAVSATPLQVMKSQRLETALCLLADLTQHEENTGSRILETRILLPLFEASGFAGEARELLLSSEYISEDEKADFFGPDEESGNETAGDEET